MAAAEGQGGMSKVEKARLWGGGGGVCASSRPAHFFDLSLESS